MAHQLRRIAALAAGLSVALLSATTFAGPAWHDRVKVKEIKKDGQAVGVKVSVTVHPDGQKLVRLGINPLGSAASLDYNKARSGGVWSKAKDGKLPYKADEIKFTDNKPVQKELTILYKDVPTLKPGGKFQVVSAYNSGGGSSYWHVWGITGVPGATPNSYDAPGKATAAKKPAAKKPAAKKPAAKKPAKKTAAKKPAAKKPAAKKPTAKKPTAASRLRSAGTSTAQRKKPAAKKPAAKKPARRTRARAKPRAQR
jgi:hypothetical protein